MTTQIRSEQALGPDQLSSFERDLGARLPNEYRRFLLSHNGARVSPNVIDIEQFDQSPVDVQEFFGIGSNDSSDITWYLREVPDRIPPGSIPIATDSGGNLFFINLEGSDAGRITYVDSFTETPRVYVVADGFDKFIDALRELE
jgi:cell wall assembly regulator SMI1